MCQKVAIQMGPLSSRSPESEEERYVKQEGKRELQTRLCAMKKRPDVRRSALLVARGPGWVSLRKWVCEFSGEEAQGDLPCPVMGK